MKRLCVSLAQVVLCCALLSWPLGVAAQPAPSFTVYDGLSYKNKPDLTQFGVRKIRIAYTSEIWGGSTARDQPIGLAVRNLAQSADPRVPLVLDIEHWKLQGDSPETTANINKLIQVVKWIHEANPNVKVGFFGLMPISDAWLELHYAQAEQDPSTPNAAGLVKLYQGLQASNQNMRRLAQYVDFVCPVLYTFVSYGGGPTKYQASWDTATINAIQEAEQYRKPIYAFVWPQFYEAKASNGDNAFMPASFWQHELQLIRGSPAQGVIIWGSPTYRKAGWVDSDPWWQATKAFLGQ